MKRSTKFLLILGLIVVLATMGGAVAVYLALFRGGPAIDDGSYLYLRPGGFLVEQPTADDPLAGILGEDAALSVIEFDSALRKAAVDDRIAGVVVRIEPMAAGLGKVQELRDAIGRFRAETDKPILAWLDMGGNKEYYLASACSEVYMAPEGMLLLTGLRFSVTFFKGTLDKLGVEAEFTRVGRYKSATEPYTREEMSEDFRAVLDSMADDLYAQIVGDIAADRGMTADQVRAIIDDPPLTARASVEAGLVDEVIYRDQLEDRLKPAGEETWTLVGLDTYGQVSPRSLGLGDGPRVAVIYCEGTINSGESSPPYWGGDQTMGSATISRALRQAREDEGIEAVVLRVDSPGGSGLASDVMWREVQLTSEVKPVVVSMSDYAASGGYYLAMAADEIVAQPGTITGSIGVFSGKFSLGGLYDKVGISVETVERGRYADLLTTSRPYTEAERRKMEQIVESFYETFVTKAAEGRGMDPLEIDRLAQGRVWTGSQAAAVGLVDRVGGFRTALDVAKERAGIDPAEEVTLVMLPERTTMLEELFGAASPVNGRAGARRRSPAGAVWPALLPGLEQPVRGLLTAAPLMASGEALAMMPFSLGID